MEDGFDRRRFDGPADAEVIEQVLAGDTQQFARLVQRYQRVLYRHAAALVLDHDAAADMVQDAFVRAYTNLRSCRDRTRFGAWLLHTLRNRCLDYLKEPRRRHVRLDTARQLPDLADGPAALAEHGELRGAIAQALAALPPEQREAFVMHYVDGIPYDAIALRLHVSVSAVKMRALRARQALAETLAPVTREAAASSVYQAR